MHCVALAHDLHILHIFTVGVRRVRRVRRVRQVRRLSCSIRKGGRHPGRLIQHIAWQSRTAKLGIAPILFSPANP